MQKTMYPLQEGYININWHTILVFNSSFLVYLCSGASVHDWVSGFEWNVSLYGVKCLNLILI